MGWLAFAQVLGQEGSRGRAARLAVITSAAGGLKAAIVRIPPLFGAPAVAAEVFFSSSAIPRVHLAIGWRGRRDVNFHSANERRAKPMKVSEGLLENQNRISA